MGADRRAHHPPRRRRRHRRHDHRASGATSRSATRDIQIIGADPVGSIYSGGEDEVKPYLVEGVGEDFWPSTFDPSVVDRYVTVSDKDSFLTTRRLAMAEGILAGGSCGTALHAALEVAAGIDDPEAMVAVILPDGGRSYLSKIYNDAWMTQYGFLERDGRPRPSATCCSASTTARREMPAARHASTPTRRSATRSRCCTSTASPSCPVVSAHDAATRRRLGRRARAAARARSTTRRCCGAEIVEVMEPPLPAVAADDPVRDAVELLVGDRQALLVTEDGRPAGIVTRADLLEALAR